jgi:RNA polymerase sigma-70 factor (ECF subfamily)
MFGKSSKAASDAELVQRCNTGDREAATAAFSALYERHREYVLRVAMRYGQDPDLAAEALQETFTQFLKQFPPPGPGLRLTAQLRTYLYTIAKNAAITALRRSARLTSAIEDLDQLPAPPTQDRSSDAIDQALAALPGGQREVLQLRFVDGYSIAEIAEALGVPPGTVKSRLHNAVNRLRSIPEIKDLFGE